MGKDEPRDILDLLDNATEGECCLFEPAAAEIRRLREERITAKVTPEELAAVREAGENWRHTSYTPYRDLGVTLRALADRMEGGK